MRLSAEVDAILDETNPVFTQTITDTWYASSETRGSLRQWKKQLAKQYTQFERNYFKLRLSPDISDFLYRKSDVGRRRAFERIRKSLGRGLVLEGVRIGGEHQCALWHILKPREAVDVENLHPAWQQNCVTVNYITLGKLPPTWSGRPQHMAKGTWTIEVPDHALGRAVARSGLRTPEEIIRHAHYNLLRSRSNLIIPDGCISDKRAFLVRAGSGGFVCVVRTGPDASLGQNYAFHIYAHTWVSNDMIRDDQVLLADDGLPGARMVDSWLMPNPVRRIFREGESLANWTWEPGLPNDLIL
jgi:hypothetical protein